MTSEQAKNLIKSVFSGKAVMTFFANIERIAKALEAKSPDKTDRNCGLSDADAAKLRAYARDQYCEEGSIEIDDIAQISDSASVGGDQGAYVQAWVWVSYADAGVNSDEA
jgi:hypothetical protein